MGEPSIRRANEDGRSHLALALHGYPRDQRLTNASRSFGQFFRFALRVFMPVESNLRRNLVDQVFPRMRMCANAQLGVFNDIELPRFFVHRDVEAQLRRKLEYAIFVPNSFEYHLGQIDRYDSIYVRGRLHGRDQSMQ